MNRAIAVEARARREHLQELGTDSPGARWYLIFTKPASEKIAEKNLRCQGYSVYYPRLSRSVLRRGRWIERIVSLFPRYVFVGLDASRQSIAPVSSTIGVASVVRFGSEPAVVPLAVMRALFNGEDPESGLHRLRSPRVPEPGARVSVLTEGLSGLEGIFEREAGSDRVIVLLRMLGREISVRVPLQRVALCDRT